MIDQKSIVLLPFPFSDLSGKKVRPALVLSNNQFNKQEDVIVCALTSQLRKKPYSLLINPQNTMFKNLRDRSQIKVDAIAKIKKDLIIKEIDKLHDDVFKKVLKILNSVFY